MSVDGRGTQVERGDTRRSVGRRLLRLLVLVIVLAVWVLVCFTWLFPWLTEIGLDPTLSG